MTPPRSGDSHPAPVVRVAAAVVLREGRYLLGRRPDGKRHGGLWEFPGGKLRPGESLENAIRRELLEEMALEVSWVGTVLLTVADGASPFVIEFVSTEARGVPVAREHQEIGWFLPDEMLGQLDLAPADAEFATQILPRARSGRG